MSSLYSDQSFLRRYSNSFKSKDVPIPYLLEPQKKSYSELLGVDVDEFNVNTSIEIDCRKKEGRFGIDRVLRHFFPIVSISGDSQLEYLGVYRLEKSHHDPQSCKDYGVTYEVKLKAKIALTVYEKTASGKRKIKERKEEEVYICNFPLITPTASFVINGTDRVVVSQLHRSPGAFFDHDKGNNSVGKRLYQARIIPYRGAWLDFEFDSRDCVFFRIDRRRRLPVSLLLRALDMNKEEILSYFYDSMEIKLLQKGAEVKLKPEDLRGLFLTFDIHDKKGNIIVQRGSRISARQIKILEDADISLFKVDDDFLIGRAFAQDIIDKATGEYIASCNDPVTPDILDQLREAKIKQFQLIYTNDLDCGDYISRTLQIDMTDSKEIALIEIYRSIRPSDPPSISVVENFFKNLFFTEVRYDLSAIGRMKINLLRKVSQDSKEASLGSRFLSKEDILFVIRDLINCRDGHRVIDDIDSLNNRRVRIVGEMVENQFRLGFLRIERSVTDLLTLNERDLDKKPGDFINIKPVSAAIRDFFATGQMSQFMDQNNPLSEITHKRRITALGPGGLSRDRSGFEVRDVHSTHYGRLCPIETPEGPNIGLINSLASYARVNEFGFLLTPFFKVENGFVTDELFYCSPIDEWDKNVACADVPYDVKTGQLLDQIILVRCSQEVKMVAANQVDYIEVSPQQIISVAASMIPFLEHDDANRALMGANMQRQAVPTISNKRPLIGTGIERQIARDSGVVVLARRSGTVVDMDATRIVVQVKEDENMGIDIYSLMKYKRSNQNGYLNQQPLVKTGSEVREGDVIADGSSVDKGELALGSDVRVAFMSWNGYNFEDSIILSNRLVQEDVFSSIHIEELSCIARSTKFGDEEITKEVPNISQSMLNRLDDSGIVYIGQEVRSGDVLVGKVAPKGDVRYTAEEKLLRAIFGEKAADVKDTGLRVPPSIQGVVVDVQIHTHPKGEQSERSAQIQNDMLETLARDFKEEASALDSVFVMLRQLMQKKTGYIDEIKEVKVSAVDIKSRSNEALMDLYYEDPSVEKLKQEIQLFQMRLQEKYDAKKKVILEAVDLAPGVLQIVKVFVAVKRKIQPGDKIAGRHGNKGVVSAIIPVEDMPFDEHGEPVDIILNPLGVPSRMNVGQLMETHLGQAAKTLGKRIAHMLRDNKPIAELRQFISQIYDHKLDDKLKSYNDDDILRLANMLSDGIAMATPAFEGYSEKETEALLELAGLDPSGKMTLYDGRTGNAFDQQVTVGYAYMMKLNHLVEDKMHARSTGPYSLVTQQPLGGRAQYGGQRLGEMEVWALEAYGAAYTLQEMLTMKSDDKKGRDAMYASLVKGEQHKTPGIPESFYVLMYEIRSLCLNMDIE